MDKKEKAGQQVKVDQSNKENYNEDNFQEAIEEVIPEDFDLMRGGLSEL